MYADWIALALVNFSFTMFLLAIIYVILHWAFKKKTTPTSDVVYRWISFFAVGVTGLYTFYLHVFMPQATAAYIGWSTSPFQFEVGMADLAIGLLAILSFCASYGFRLATVIGTTIWLWGDAAVHVQQMMVKQNFVAAGNAGSWFWMDVIVPIILILCIMKLRKRSMY